MIVPDDLKNVWTNNFELIQNLGQIKFKRAMVTEDAVNLEIETIEMADASQNLACGEFSCQFIFSRSKIFPKGMTIPRAELFATFLNATIGYVVYTALTDSQINLFWINNTKSQMKMGRE